MDVALIPPYSLMLDTKRTQMQLMLPQHYYNAYYKKVYDEHLRSPSQYVIMDNGAAEYDQPKDAELFRIASETEPNEMAIPDHLGDMVNTIDHAFEFIEKWGLRLKRNYGVRLGYVAQGCDAEEAFYGVCRVMNSFRGVIDTIYIPRLLVKRGEMFARIFVANLVHETFPEVMIHCFGAAAKWPGEVIELTKVPHIRSIDTSLPYQMSFAKAPMRRRAKRPVSRPDMYFSRAVPEFPNIDVYVERYLKWANYNRAGSIPPPSAKSAL